MVKLRSEFKRPGPLDLDRLENLMSLIDDDEWFAVQAHVRAFGSKEVVSAFERFLTARAVFLATGSVWSEIEEFDAKGR